MSVQKSETAKKVSGSDIDATTPGRPKDSGSRQQTQAGQTLNSGSPGFDAETANGTGSTGTDADAVPVKPPATK